MVQCIEITKKGSICSFNANNSLHGNCGLCTKHYNIRKKNGTFEDFCQQTNSEKTDLEKYNWKENTNYKKSNKRYTFEYNGKTYTLHENLMDFWIYDLFKANFEHPLKYYTKVFEEKKKKPKYSTNEDYKRFINIVYSFIVDYFKFVSTFHESPSSTTSSPIRRSPQRRRSPPPSPLQRRRSPPVSPIRKNPTVSSPKYVSQFQPHNSPKSPEKAEPPKKYRDTYKDIDGTIYTIRVDVRGNFSPWVYEYFKISNKATFSDFKKAYRTLALKLHPDRYKDQESKLKAERNFKILNWTYDFVKNYYS